MSLRQHYPDDRSDGGITVVQGDSGHVYRLPGSDAQATVPRWQRWFYRLFHRKQLSNVKDFID